PPTAEEISLKKVKNIVIALPAIIPDSDFALRGFRQMQYQ
ncbi:unnamed protein product, partial [marine sediment metagenome]